MRGEGKKYASLKSGIGFKFPEKNLHAEIGMLRGLGKHNVWGNGLGIIED